MLVFMRKNNYGKDYLYSVEKINGKWVSKFICFFDKIKIKNGGKKE